MTPTHLTQAWLLYGYDAAVLGGVQATEPFLKALGVCVSDTIDLDQVLTAAYSIRLESMSFRWLLHHTLWPQLYAVSLLEPCLGCV